MRPQTILWLLVLGLVGCQRGPTQVVVYCAAEPHIAEPLWADFTATHGIQVVPIYRHDGTTSISFFDELRREAAKPRCDVYWNNDLLSTIRLARLNHFEPYRSPMGMEYPVHCYDRDLLWYQFASRTRVFLVSNQVPPEEGPKSWLDVLQPRWKEQLVMAEPFSDTAATEAACLFTSLGADTAKDFYRGLKRNQVRFVADNKQAAQAVVDGKAQLAFTDSDVAVELVKAGQPVHVVLPDLNRPSKAPLQELGVLEIPQTLALVKNAPHPRAGQRLIEYLLSKVVEKRLAEGPGHFYPQNPQVRVNLPEAIHPGGQAFRGLAVDYHQAAQSWDESQAFLRELFGK